jgi:MarR family transcriptional regulator, organic hydroperoxide resistance regulator
MARRPIVEEIKQTRPFRSRSQEAAIALLRTANVLSRSLDALCQSHGLTGHQQYNVLRILRGAKGPLPTMEIAERLIEQTPGITRHVNKLEEQGLIRREQWPGDRRQVLCQITPAGLRVLERMEDPMNALDDGLGAALTPRQLDDFIEALDVIRASPVLNPG